MDIYVRDKEMPKHCGDCPLVKMAFNADEINYFCNGIDNPREDTVPNWDCKNKNCPLKSLDQHDLEIRADERKKVVEEVIEWVEDNVYAVDVMDDFIVNKIIFIDYRDLRQKLAELKGEKDE